MIIAKKVKTPLLLSVMMAITVSSNPVLASSDPYKACAERVPADAKALLKQAAEFPSTLARLAPAKEMSADAFKSTSAAFSKELVDINKLYAALAVLQSTYCGHADFLSDFEAKIVFSQAMEYELHLMSMLVGAKEIAYHELIQLKKVIAQMHSNESRLAK